MKTVITISRWIVGLLFIFSGLVKANDPLGLSYKMQEFFEVWGWQGLQEYTLSLSAVMNVFEVLAGVAVLLGWRMRLFSWLLLLLILFFTFLTGYAVLSGKIKTCGCFGDCLPLTPVQSFGKDLFLLLLILVLFLSRRRIHTTLQSPVSLVLLVLVVLATGWLQLHVLRHLPLVDCLPYKKGNNILRQMEVPEGAAVDSFVITFKYKKNGKLIEFDAANMPADLDSSYEYIDRYDKLVRKGNAVAPIEDFALITASGYDTTRDILQHKGKYVLVLVQHFDQWEAFAPALNQVAQAAAARHLPLVIATPAAGKAQQLVSAPGALILTCDATVVKTAARVVPTFFVMNGADILEKKGYRDAEQVVAAVQQP